MRELHWTNAAQILIAPWPCAWGDWLLAPGSLTQRLRKVAGTQFRLERIGHRWGQASADEAQLLGIALRSRVLIREVYLCQGDHVWVYARSLIPALYWQGAGRALLARVGHKPLGDVLFKPPYAKPGPLQIAQITPQHRGYAMANARVEGPLPAHLWARRRVFYTQNARLLVSEMFLPAIFTINVESTDLNVKQMP